VISFIAYLLFAMFCAGIPRKRYFGYIYLGSFIAVLNTVFTLFVNPWHDLFGNLFMLALVLFWLFWFVLSGVMGLYAFRKKE
jgi:signal transduction histidine kinase